MSRFEEYFRKPLSDFVSPILRSVLEPLDALLIGLPPAAWLGCAVGLFVIEGILVWTLRHSYVFLGAPDQARWRDLRIWSTLLLVPYILIYLLLGR